MVKGWVAEMEKEMAMVAEGRGRVGDLQAQHTIQMTAS
jgi:hypothetical protein